MDENLVGQLGSKMRTVYDDVAADPPVPAVGTPKHPSRRLRKIRTAGGKRPRAAGAAGSLASRGPLLSLLAAAAAGYVLARLSRA